MNIAWDITSKCNLSCLHCYNARNYSNTAYSRNANDITMTTALSWIRTLKENQIKTIQFLGGEPFIGIDFLDILHYACQCELECNISTNGIVVSGTTVAKLAEIGPRQIAFSIDGASGKSNDYIRGAGSFYRSIANLRKLSDYFQAKRVPTRLGIQFTLHKLNGGDILPIIDVAKELSLHFVSFDMLKTMSPDAPNSQILSELAPSFEDVSVQLKSDTEGLLVKTWF